MSDKQSKVQKVMKSYRLDSKTVQALERKADELKCDQTWLVETILATSLGLRAPLRPPKVAQVAKIAA